MVLVRFVTAAAAAALGLTVLASEYADRPRPGFLVSSKEDAEAMKLKLEMPGLGKEHVMVLADKDVLMIEGKGDKDTEYDDGKHYPVWYSGRVKLPADAKMDQIKAEMKDGVLKVTVPKINGEKGKDVFEVKVE